MQAERMRGRSDFRLFRCGAAFVAAVFAFAGAWVAGVPAAVAAEQVEAGTAKILFVGAEDNVVAQGLRALDVPFERCDTDELGRRSLFTYDLIIVGMDVPRDMFNRQRDETRAFVDSGGFILGFRCKTGRETWLPADLGRDRGYSFGEVLIPEHPIFVTPNRLSTDMMRTVHDVGSIYNAFCELGEGWIPLASAGKPLNWDKRQERVSGPHYGIVELAYGTGRILLLDMIPAYNWFRDRDGDGQAPGALFFENLVTYALSRAPRRAAARPAPVRPAGLVDDLEALWAVPVAGARESFDASAWSFETSGPYTTETDRRGVIALRHEDTPSTAGNYAQATTTVALPKDARHFSLVWYESDTYCGGRERILGGEKHGQTALQNFKRAHRFKEVLVNGHRVWEADVLGRNPQPTSRRFHRVDITDRVRAGAATCDVTVRVADRQGSGDLPFAIEVYYACVAVAPGAFSSPAGTVLSGSGAVADAAGVFSPSAGAVQLTGDLGLPPGRYRLGVRVRDGAYGRSTLKLAVDGADASTWQLTADDHRFHWFVTPLVDVQRGRIAVSVDVDNGEAARIAEIAAIPERLLRNDTGLAAEEPPRAPQTVVQTGPVRFEAVIAETAGVARANEICVQTFPFAQGVLADARAIRVLADDGGALPVQTRLVAAWPDGSVKVVATAFPVSVPALGRRTVTVEAGKGIRPGASSGGLTLREDDDGIVLDTGAIRAVLGTSRGTVFEQVRRDDGWLLAPGKVCELVVEDADGRVARSSESPVTSTEIVERGPLRALIVRKGTLTLAEGSALDYRLQVEAAAGSDALRTQAFIVNRSDAEEIYLKRWSFRLAHAGGASRVWLGAERSAAAEPGDVLYQHREDTLTWTGSEGHCVRASGLQAPGFVRLPGILFGTRWFWQRFPQAIRFESGVVRQDFIPQAFDDRDLPTRWAARMSERTDAYPVGGVGYPQSPGRMGLFRVARGEALRQEILCSFDGGGASGSPDGFRALLDARLRAAADPRYVSTTRVYGVMHPADTRMFPGYEASVEHFLKGYLGKRSKRREYGFQNYGDDTFEWGYGPSHTYWSNSEYDHHHGFAMQYLRSGDPRWWDEFEKTARFYCDTVIIHHEPEGGSRPQRGGPRHHNYTALWMASQPEQPWIADHTMKPADSGHAWAQGVVDAWFLTGDPWAGEVLQDVAEWYCRIVEANRYGAGGQERGPGWALVALSALTRATNDARVRAAGQSVADWIVAWQDPVRGVVSVPISEQPSYEGGTVFMHGIVGRGLGRWYDVTGDLRVREALIRLADWLVTEPMEGTGRFWYKQAPNCMTRHSSTSQTVSALAYAFDLTGDPVYEDVASTLVKGGGADVRALSWYPDALARLARTRRPAEVFLGADRIVAVPGEESVMAVSVRNTQAGPVQVSLNVAASGPFEVSGEPEATVDAGDTAQIPVRIRCGKAPATGRADIAVRLSAAGCEPVERAFSVALCAVAGVHRIELGGGDVVVTPPVTVVREGGTVVVDTPRPADFSGSPLAMDSAGRGSAMWEFEVEEPGTYTLWADVCWIDAKGNSFYVQVDDGPEQVLGNSGDMQRWIWVAGPATELAAGTHRIVVRTREEGSRLRGLWLSSSSADRPPGAVAE